MPNDINFWELNNAAMRKRGGGIANPAYFDEGYDVAQEQQPTLPNITASDVMKYGNDPAYRADVTQKRSDFAARGKAQQYASAIPNEKGVAVQSRNDGGAGGTSGFDYLMQLVQKPTPPDPKAQMWQRNAASIAEGIKSLAEMYGQHKGAHLRERQPKENDKAEKYIQYVNQKFDADNKEYQNAILRLKMAQKAREDEQQQQAEARAYTERRETERREYEERKKKEQNDFTLKLYGMKDKDKQAAAAQKQEYELEKIKAREVSTKRINASKQGSGESATITISNNDGSRQATMTQNQYKTVAANIYKAMQKGNYPPIVQTKFIKDPTDYLGKTYKEETVKVTNPSSQQIQDYVSGYINELGDDVWDYLEANKGVKTTSAVGTQYGTARGAANTNTSGKFGKGR